jgi:putative DNA primase/helicase
MPAIIDKLDRADPTHDELADEFVARNPGIAFGQGRFMRYDGASWGPMADEEADREILGTLVDAKPRGIKPTSYLKASVEVFVRAKTFVPDSRWDANTDIIVTRDSTLDIAQDGSYTVRPNDPEDYARDALPFAFDPNANAPVWRYFLDDVLGEAERAYLQEFAGYCLTGDTSLEHAVLTVGPRGGGRSTFQVGLNAMLGARRGTLSIKDIAESRFGLSGIVGKTLLSSTENPGDYLKTTATINQVISGDTVKIERKGKDAFDYDPIAKILWAMNDLPQLRDQQSGLWRRVHVVNFPAIPEDKRDPSVKEAIKCEGPGILVWALEGLRRLRQRGGFDVPPSVRAATEDYRADNDLAAQFLAYADIKPGTTEVSAQSLTKAYNAWRDDNGSGRVSTTTAGKEWARLGFEAKHTKRGNKWLISRVLLEREPPGEGR